MICKAKLKALNISMTKSIRLNIGDREIKGDDYFAVIEPVFSTVSIYDGPERYEKDLANFSGEQPSVS